MIRLAASALVLVLAATGVAQADSPYRGHDAPRHSGQSWRGHDGNDQRESRDGRGRRDQRDWHGQRDGRGGYYGHTTPRPYYAPRPYYTPRGYYGHRWARGQWLPAEYRTRHYYVPDYWRYGQRVYAPPVGCRWVRYDGDLVLTALATGLVLDVIYDAYD